ncbi:MAG: histidine--tRNA ligase [Alphaproteobacteria bacterium]
MAKLQPVRGTHDLLPEQARSHHHVVETARAVAARYCYNTIDTPIFEFTEVFKRTLGETSDVVSKEMYSFDDKGGDSITLRPEGTAGVARAVISGGLAQQLPLKFFYAGPMFRYERPQKGRQRQFHQIGVELLGVPEPAGDVEIIALGAQILEELGLRDRTRLELNTLGDQQSRAEYRRHLDEFLGDHKTDLSADSQHRLDRNPLRILDSKDPGDRAIVVNAPKFIDHLTEQASEFFAAVRAGLDDLGIVYELNPRIVRGLDYYCHTTFEFTTTDLGAQGTVLAGGRYDGLMEIMGGPPTPGVGWAGGIERMVMMAGDATPAPRPFVLIPVGDEAVARAGPLAHRLRRAGLTVDLAHRGNLSRRMKRANKINARVAILIGEDELQRHAATVRDLDSGEQVEVSLDDLEASLAQFR